MSSFAPVVVAIALLPTLLLGCAGEGVSDPGATQDPSVIALASSGSRPSTRRTLNPSQTNARQRPIGVKPNVDAPIPFDRPAGAVVPTIASVSSPGTETPALPLGGQPNVTGAVAAVCKPALALKLNCPPDAPIPSTCTSADNLPVGCHAITVPGATPPANAIPACCL
jgi:hypothetical protein